MDRNKMELVICALVTVFACSLAQDRPLVQLSTGLVRGWVIVSNANNVSMNVFKGIPYAQPPIGELRFKAPVAVESWTVEKNLSLTDSPDCPQNSPSWGTSTTYSEDCLILNVYTPQNATSASKLPVMVWIYGGALEGGSSGYASYAPDFFIEQNVIFVSMNYRVGVLGFLNLGTANVSGNAGLKDQRLALQWVQREIANFGGDKSQVTIFGESAGSTCVNFHYISPNSQGLFARAISESGNSLSETTFLETGYLERAATFAGLVNCTDSSNNVNLTCLQAVSVTSILANQQITLNDTYVIPANTIRFPATPEIASDSAVLTDTPQNMLNNLINSNYSRVPVILGVNHDEGTLTVTTNETYYSELVNKLKYFIPPKILAQKSDSEITNNSATIYQEYFNSTPPSLTNLNGYIKIYGDKMFKVVTALFARQVASFGNVYIYHFGYSGNFVFSQGPSGTANISGTVGHGDELNYLFYNPSLNQTSASANSTDLLILRSMVKLWTNFAIYGNPTPNASSNDTVLSTLSWTPISNASYPYLHILSNIQMNTSNFYEHEVTFWNGIYTVASPSFASKTAYSVMLLVVNLLICKLLM